MAALRRLAPLVATLLFAPLPLVVELSRGHAARSALPVDLRSAPQDLAHYRAVKDEPLAADVLDMLEPDSYVMRLYTSDGGATAWLYLASYSAGGSTGAHDPSVCYPAQGWDLQGLHTLDVELTDGESLTGRLMVATQAGLEELVLYWFQPVGRWPQRAPWEQLLRAYDGFSGRPQYVFVRLSAPRTDRTQEELIAMGRELAPWLRDAMARATRPASDSAPVRLGMNDFTGSSRAAAYLRDRARPGAGAPLAGPSTSWEASFAFIRALIRNRQITDRPMQ